MILGECQLRNLLTVDVPTENQHVPWKGTIVERIFHLPTINVQGIFVGFQVFIFWRVTIPIQSMYGIYLPTSAFWEEMPIMYHVYINDTYICIYIYMMLTLGYSCTKTYIIKWNTFHIILLIPNLLQSYWSLPVNHFAWCTISEMLDV